jgi:RimJ/RimL family protein N-acetyltransferase
MITNNLEPPIGWERIVTLRSWGQAVVRPIRATDARGLIAGFDRLSPESIYYRFFIKRKELGLDEAEHWAEVDYHQRMAFVAELVAREDYNDLIGVARYEPVSGQPNTVEMAMILGDPFQNQGLGRPLLYALGDYALTRGYMTMIAEVLNDNERMFRFLERSGYPMERHLEDITTRFVITLQPSTSLAKPV